MKKALMIASVLVIAVVSTACINNIAVQELNNKAAEYMEKGDYDSAMNRLQASLDLDSTMYQTYYNLGVAAIKAEKYEKAIEAFESGIKINPEYPDFYYSLGAAQMSRANEIGDKIDASIDNPKKSSDENIEEDKLEETFSIEDLPKVIELKRDAIVNLSKYLELAPQSNDKDNVAALIEEANEFIKKASENPIKALK